MCMCVFLVYYRSTDSHTALAKTSAMTNEVIVVLQLFNVIVKHFLLLIQQSIAS